MRKRNYLIRILILLFVFALAFTAGIYFYGRLSGKVIEYRDLAAIFTAVIVSGSFIISTLNTKLSADLNESKLQFDRAKFDSDKRVMACNLFKEYNSEEMVAHNEAAVVFMNQYRDIGDKGLIKELFLDIFKLHYKKFDLYIKTKQKKSANYFDNFEAIAREWLNDSVGVQ
jgi:hypothetical protein